jgi:N-acetylmuramoyl-L-alanine amidase
MTKHSMALSFVLVVVLLLLALPVGAQGTSVVHVVDTGETIGTIAQHYGVTPQSIIQANNLVNPSRIYAGQHLTIPLGNAGAGGGSSQTYVVQPGDSLTKIAARFGITVQALAEYNVLPVWSWLYVGQVLFIPGTAIIQPPIQPPVYPPAPTYYTVVPGDTMFRIAARFNRDMWNIARANNILNLNRIYVGQTLFIP